MEFIHLFLKLTPYVLVFLWGRHLGLKSRPPTARQLPPGQQNVTLVIQIAEILTADEVDLVNSLRNGPKTSGELLVDLGWQEIRLASAIEKLEARGLVELTTSDHRYRLI